MPTSSTDRAARLIGEALGRTAPFRSFARRPLCYVDVGAAGGMPPAIAAVAPFVQAVFFEPDAEEFERVLAAVRGQGFADVHGVSSALGGKRQTSRLHLTVSRVNSSLLAPNEAFWTRYGNKGGAVERVVDMDCAPMDEALSGLPVPPDIIKTDCQGLDCEILEAAPKCLENAVCVVAEVIIAQAYHGQKGLAEICALLSGRGFSLYGLIPHYVSCKLLDRRENETNERLMHVDAIFFRDPLSEASPAPKLTERQEQALFAAACIYGYYDFALELCQHMPEGPELAAGVRQLARAAGRCVEEELGALLGGAQPAGQSPYLRAKLFAEAAQGLNDVAHLRARKG